MPSTGNSTIDLILYSAVCVVLLFLGFQVGRMIATLSASKRIAAKEQELFTTQKGFKNLYEQEINSLKQENGQLKAQMAALETRVEEYRKKAAGFGGLFNTGGKRADAMYALLLENEALEEALYAQNEKLRQERTDALKDQMRATSYRRVLMSQLLNDDRIKDYVAEILSDEKRLPPPNHAPANTPALPDGSSPNPPK